MNKECLSHLLKEAERNHFEEQGHLVMCYLSTIQKSKGVKRNENSSNRT
ncbi:MAG: hypothetical protein OXI43_20915 [Candidatus Poribacteria bacterium]|nr:hypothetical protein [Candidatus Poribacteria bacterium]